MPISEAYVRSPKSLTLFFFLITIIFLSCKEEKSESIIPQPPNCNLLKSHTGEYYTIHTVTSPPQFKDTPKNLSNIEKKDYLSKGIRDIIVESFSSIGCVYLEEDIKHRIDVLFDIDCLGNVQNIKSKAKDIRLQKEATRVIGMLPQFIPAIQNNKAVSIRFSQPIIFQVQE